MSDLATRFERFLRFAEPDRAGDVLTCEPITGGYSRISARAQVRWAPGEQETFILRGDPPPGSGVFTSDRDAEWALLQALPGTCGVATPAARYYDDSGAHLGSKCIVMECADGVSLQARLAESRDVWADACLFIDTFAAVHATPVENLALPRPADWNSYLDGVLAGYDRLAETYPSSAPVLRYVSSWAAVHKPPPVPLALVHGDCQPTNILVGADNRPLLIDWEFAHVGDPREDLGYYTQIPMAPNVYWADPERFLARYRERSGLTEEQVNPEVVDYFLIIGMAALLGQLLEAADAVGTDDRSGILAAYLINAISHQYDMFLDICDRLG